ncbi:MAG TPA: peroxiredoxin [Betaproteobacteria bacterium]|nr:peroxiredoxin [Betaproteobacteria bacterium]
MLQCGAFAPDFSLPDVDMEMVGLSDFRGIVVVLYFYPRDDTPGCTQEAIEFSDLEDAFRELNAVVLGVSRDDCLRHADFRDKHGLAVRLLSDADGELCDRYGVWREKESDGVKRMGVLRSTFVIDPAGIVRHALYGVTPKGHAAEVLALVSAMSSKD